MLKQEHILLKITLLISLLGVLLLIIISNYLPKQASSSTLISSLEELPEGTAVIVSGTISSVIDTPSILILQVKDTSGTIKVIADKDHLETKLTKNAQIEVEGTLKTYKDEREIQASHIKVYN